MKRQAIILLLLVAASFFFPHCTGTSQQDLPQGIGQISFSNGTLRIANAFWQAGDKIGVFALPMGQSFSETSSKAANLPYSTKTAGANASFTADDATMAVLMPEQSEALDFYAYYPYNSEVKEQLRIDIAYSEGKRRLDDIIYSDNARGISKASQPDNRVVLVFRHMMSELLVMLNDTEGQAIKGAKVSILGVPLSGSFYIPTAAFDKMGESGQMELSPKEAGNYSAILIPDSVKANTKILVEYEDKTYSHLVTFPTFESGKRYTVTLKLNAAKGVDEEVFSVDGAIIDRDTGESVSGEVAPGDDESDDDLPSKENNYLDETVVGNPELLEMPRPTGGKHNYLVTHNVNGAVNYSLEYDTKLRATRFVAFTFDRTNSQKNVGRKDAWSWDPFIPTSFAVDREDFSGYSRGHLVASNDRVDSRPANSQTFYYSNMTPQTQQHNAGVWLQLEALLQGLARDKELGDDVYYVAKGASPDKSKTGFLIAETPTGVPVSRYLWMSVVYKQGDEYYGIAFLTEHDKPKRVTSIRTLAMSIDELEKFIGYDFFFNLPDQIETVVEKQEPKDYLHIWPGI